MAAEIINIDTYLTYNKHTNNKKGLSNVSFTIRRKR